MDSKKIGKTKGFIYFLSGYTSELSLEVLATVDFILKDNENMTIDQVMQAISHWSNRKTDLFSQDLVELAYHHLIQYRTEVFA
ncbi:MAG: hypothetical protein IPN86_00055 [Saprospiraceae bacterium]|nr:hypothetical protein [Saprospiraceae bacterium]